MYFDLSLEVNPSNIDTPIAKLGHFGTHIDVMDKSTQIPVENFFCTAVLIDISKIREHVVEKEDLVNFEINQNDFVIFRSNWMKDFGYGTREYSFNHPHFSDEAIDYLISKNIRFIGLDFPGAQRKEKHKIIDQKCADHQIFIIENLNNLDLLTKNKFAAFCFPMHFSGMSGVPIRVVALLN
jgi:kynurenine formamidase